MRKILHSLNPACRRQASFTQSYCASAAISDAVRQSREKLQEVGSAVVQEGKSMSGLTTRTDPYLWPVARPSEYRIATPELSAA
jgi:hypothetical protein